MLLNHRHQLCLALFGWIALCPLQARAVGADPPWQFGYRGSAERYQSADSLLFRQSARWHHQLVLDAEYQQDGARLHLVGRQQWREQRGAAGQQQEDVAADQLILAEWYLDTSLDNVELTFGKKRLNWGVGYAQQPLNIITTEARMATGVVVEEGAWLLSAERYTDQGVWTVLAASSKTQQSSASAQPNSVGVRYYQLAGGWDLQALAFTDNINRLRLGGSAVGVLGEQTTVHLTGLWQQRYQRWPALSASGPLLSQQFINAGLAPPDGGNTELACDWPQAETAQHGWQWLTGAFFSFPAGLSLLAEYWYDSRAYSRQQWQDLFDLAAGSPQHGDSTDVSQLLQSGQLMFSTPNLLAHNLMLYLSYEQPDWQVKADLQWTPQDGGYVLTSRLGWPLAQSGQLEVGNRFYGGPASAVYSQVPNRQEWFLRFNGRF